MKQIDAFVNELYKNASGNNKEVLDLKAEMKSHLIESVYELKSEGKSEKEAVRVAIERFGKENELRSIISELVKTQKVFGKMLLYIGITILLVSIAISGYFLNVGSGHEREQAETAYAIGNIVESDSELKVIDAKVKQLLEDKIYIKNVDVYLGDNRAYPVYEVGNSKGINFPLIYDSYSYGANNSTVSIDIINYRGFGILSILIGISTFGTLLVIWTIINIYHKRRRSVI